MVPDMNRRPASLTVGPVQIDIDAPAALLFEMLGAIGQGIQRPGERAEILERHGDHLVCDFWSIVPMPFGRVRSVRTREAVHVMAPDRIDFEHLDGPVRGLRESITVEARESARSRLVYRGIYVPRGPLARLVFRVVSRRGVERAVDSHFADLRGRAEARAANSRVFRAEPDDAGGERRTASPAG